MKLRWEPPRDGLARGFGADGDELAQISHVFSPTGDDRGWTVWLASDQGVLFDHFETAELAMGAAESALDAEP